MPDAADLRLASMDEHIALPRQNGELLFAAPWEARAFGIAVALHEAGVYPWRAFSQGLAAATAAAEQGGVPTSYYERWLAALASLAIARGLVQEEELERKIQAYALGVPETHAAHDHDYDHDHDHEPPRPA